MQAWVRRWMDEEQRLDQAKALVTERITLTSKAWGRNTELLKRKIELPTTALERFRQRTAKVPDTQALLLAEAEWARALYASLSAGHGLNFTRQEGVGAKGNKEERVNSFLDHGNYIAYGLAAVALNGLGISYAFPLLHGKTRRGALVFDIADLIKDAYVMPLAFTCGVDSRIKDNAYRALLIESLQDAEALDFLFGFVKQVCEISP